MDDFIIRVILEATFIFGSILTLYCLYFFGHERATVRLKSNQNEKSLTIPNSFLGFCAVRKLFTKTDP